MTRRLAIGIGVALLIQGSAHGTVPGASFTLDSRFFTGQASNEAVARFGMEFHEAIYKAYHLGEPRDRMWRVFYALGAFFVLGELGLQSSWFVSNHEYGHASRADAFGAERRYVAHDDSTYQDFFPYFIRNLFGRARSGAVALDTTGFSTEDVFVVFAAGMNNSSYFAEHIDRQTRDPHTSYVYLVPYLDHRLDAFEYASYGGTDIDVVIQYYQGFKGYDIDHGDVKAGSVVSLLASNTFWSTLIGLGRGLYEGTHHARPLRIGNVDLPNFSFYLTSQGISMKSTVCWYVAPGWRAIPGLEWVYSGDMRLEPSVRVEWQPLPWSFAGELTASKGVALGVSGRRRFGPWFAGAGARVYQGDTLEGERLSPNLRSSTAAQLWVNAGFTY